MTTQEAIEMVEQLSEAMQILVASGQRPTKATLNAWSGMLGSAAFKLRTTTQTRVASK